MASQSPLKIWRPHMADAAFHPDSNLPGCMMPDGGDCCAGYQALLADWRRLRDVAAKPLGPCTQAELDAFEGLDSKSKQLFLMWVERAQKAEAALGAAQAAWQPIETAPKDGHKIDLWVTPPKGALTTGDYGRVSDCWHSDGKWWFYDETKYASDSANCRSEVWNVTHWMSRPTPPISSTNRGTP